MIWLLVNLLKQEKWVTMNNTREAELRGEIDFTRHRDWYDPAESDAEVTIVGCGGIGSPTALALAKLGIPKLTLIDGDTVEKHNIPNQMFPLTEEEQDNTGGPYTELVSTFGKPKVHVLENVLNSFSVTDIEAHYKFLNSDGLTTPDNDLSSDIKGYKPSGIVVSGLDSMSARQEVWKTVKFNMGVDLYIDARLGGELIVIYAVNPKDYASCQTYEESLHSDENARELPCTRRIVIDVGFVVAGLITRTIRRHLAGGKIEHDGGENHIDPVLMFNQESLSVTR